MTMQKVYLDSFLTKQIEVARKGAKLWEAPTKMRPIQKSPRIPTDIFRGSYMDGKEFNLSTLISKTHASLVCFFFNQFGEVGAEIIS
jgi:hypothetical protein